MSAQQVTGAGSGLDEAWFVGVSLGVSAPALTGTAFATLRWTDPNAGAKSKTYPVLLTLLNNLEHSNEYLWIKDGTYVTIEVAVVGLLGTPTFTVTSAAKQAYP